jgi:iron complex transport system substrate-binding protein
MLRCGFEFGGYERKGLTPLYRNFTIRAAWVNRESPMRQQRIFGLAATLALGAAAVATVLLAGWPVKPPDFGPNSSQIAPMAAKEPRVASVTPAGTDLLIGIGAADHLVGVSNYDDPREGIVGKPKIGDYQNIDWETLAQLKPQILIVFYAADRIPPALQQRCEQMEIRIVNVKLETMDNIYAETDRLAQAVGEIAAGKAAVAALKAKLAATAHRVAGLPRVKTLIVTGDSGLGVAGPGTFLDELLKIAGGENAVSSPGPLYREIDKEMLRSLAPDAVIQLIPDGEKTPQILKTASQFWDSLPEIPAVRDHQVHVLTEWYSMQPGFRVGILSEKFADILHPEKLSTSSEAAKNP